MKVSDGSDSIKLIHMLGVAEERRKRDRAKGRKRRRKRSGKRERKGGKGQRETVWKREKGSGDVKGGKK